MYSIIGTLFKQCLIFFQHFVLEKNVFYETLNTHRDDVGKCVHYLRNILNEILFKKYDYCCG